MTTDRRGRPVVSVHPEIRGEAAAYRRLPRAAAAAVDDRATSPTTGDDQQATTEPPATP